MKFKYGDMVYSIYDKWYDEMMILKFDEKKKRYLCIHFDGIDVYGSAGIGMFLEEELALLNDELIPGSRTYLGVQAFYKECYPENIDIWYYPVNIHDKTTVTKYRGAIKHDSEDRLHTI